jgi:prepilin-type N-terminal cleavage/methylation domain-containing protein
MKSRKFKVKSGFTLVELLIVVIILAILAAIVVPQFASSSDDAQVSALDANLAGIRGAIELYYQQHSNTYPGANTAAQGTCTADVSAAAGAPSFIAQMTFYTDTVGNVCDIKDATFRFGPYLKNGLPANPMTSISTLAVVSTGSLSMTDDGAAQGWKFDTVSGKFIANDNTLDINSNKYSTH